MLTARDTLARASLSSARFSRDFNISHGKFTDSADRLQYIYGRPCSIRALLLACLAGERRGPEAMSQRRRTIGEYREHERPAIPLSYTD